MDLHGLRFVLQVWSASALKRSGALKSALNRSVWGEFAARGIRWSVAWPGDDRTAPEAKTSGKGPGSP